MDAQEATRTFKQAEALYAKGRHAEALQLLENLDLNFPNTKNILYPKALCLTALGRKAEASAAQSVVRQPPAILLPIPICLEVIWSSLSGRYPWRRMLWGVT